MVEVEDVALLELEPVSTSVDCIKIGAGCVGCFFADQCLQARVYLAPEDDVEHIETPLQEYLEDMGVIDIGTEDIPTYDNIEASSQPLYEVHDAIAADPETVADIDYTSELEDDSVPVVVAHHLREYAQAEPVKPRTTSTTQAATTPIRDTETINPVVQSSDLYIEPVDQKPITNTETKTPTQSTVLEVATVAEHIVRIDIPPIQQTHKEKDDKLTIIDEPITMRKHSEQVIRKHIVHKDSIQHSTILRVKSQPSTPAIHDDTSSNIPVSQEPQIIAYPEDTFTLKNDEIPGFFTDTPTEHEEIQVSSTNSPDTLLPVDSAINLEDPQLLDNSFVSESAEQKHDILRHFRNNKETLFIPALEEYIPILSGIDGISDPEIFLSDAVSHQSPCHDVLRYIAMLALSVCHVRQVDI